MNILVTGGQGFIGSHLVDALSEIEGNSITVLDFYPASHYDLPTEIDYVQASITDTDLVRRTLEDKNIELIYHLAWATIPETSLANLSSDIEANLIPSVKLISVCPNTSVKRIIYVSSGGTVYGIPQVLPVPESHPTNPISAYGITKLMVEKYLKLFFHLHGLEYLIIRPSVPYGPRQNPHRRQGVVSVFTYNALKDKPVTIWGSGDTISRDYFYISDLTKALINAGRVPFEPDAEFNVAGDRVYNLNHLIKTIEEVLNKKVKVNYEPPRNFDVPNIQLNITKARQKLDWFPHVRLEEGISLTAQWLAKYID